LSVPEYTERRPVALGSVTVLKASPETCPSRRLRIVFSFVFGTIPSTGGRSKGAKEVDDRIQEYLHAVEVLDEPQ